MAEPGAASSSWYLPGAFAAYGFGTLADHFYRVSGYNPGLYVPSTIRSPTSTRFRFGMWDTLTANNLHALSPKQMEMFVRQVHYSTQSIPGGLETFRERVERGQTIARHFNLDSSFAAQTAYGAIAFGEAFGSLGGPQGFGGLSKQEAIALDQQLRASAAASPMANALGAVMAMYENGLISPDSDASVLVEAIKNRDQEVLQTLATSDPSHVARILEKSGISASTISSFMASRTTSQAMTAKYNIGDIVRGMQRDAEVSSFIKTHIGASTSEFLRAQGVTEGSIAAVEPKLTEIVRASLFSMSSEDLQDPIKRNKAIINNILESGDAQLIKVLEGLGAAKTNEMLSVALTNLETARSQHSAFQAYGNLTGMITMHRGDIQSEANERMQSAQYKAVVSSIVASEGSGSAVQRAVEAAMSDEAKDPAKLTSVVAAALGGSGISREKIGSVSQQLVNMRINMENLRRAHTELKSTQDPAKREELEKYIAAIEKNIGTDAKIISTALNGSAAAPQPTEAQQAAVASEGSAAAASSRRAAGSASYGPNQPITVRGRVEIISRNEAELTLGEDRAGEPAA